MEHSNFKVGRKVCAQSTREVRRCKGEGGGRVGLLVRGTYTSPSSSLDMITSGFPTVCFSNCKAKMHRCKQFLFQPMSALPTHVYLALPPRDCRALPTRRNWLQQYNVCSRQHESCRWQGHSTMEWA